MGRTKVRGVQIVSDTIDSDLIKQGSVSRADLNTTTVGSAVIAKVVQGTGITITSTGADSGTGDVTISASGNYLTTEDATALMIAYAVALS